MIAVQFPVQRLAGRFTVAKVDVSVFFRVLLSAVIVVVTAIQACMYVCVCISTFYAHPLYECMYVLCLCMHMHVRTYSTCNCSSQKQKLQQQQQNVLIKQQQEKGKQQQQ